MDIVGILFILFVVLLIHSAGIKLMRDYREKQDAGDAEDRKANLDLSDKQ